MDAGLIARAAEMFGVRRTWVLGGRRYAIEGSAPHAIWYVDLSLNPPYCSCPQFAYRCRDHELCKHQVFFYAFGAFLEKVQQVSPGAPAQPFLPRRLEEGWAEREMQGLRAERRQQVAGEEPRDTGGGQSTLARQEHGALEPRNPRPKASPNGYHRGPVGAPRSL